MLKGSKTENRRRNNPQNMSVTETLYKVREEMCDKYCKYVYDEEITQEDLELHCNGCPMNRL